MKTVWGSASSRNSVWKPCRVGLLLTALILATLYWHDPATTTWWPRCWFHELTGWQCIACGASRALHGAVHGDWATAWRLNPLLWLALPWAAVTMVAPRRGRRWFLTAGIAGAVLFMVARNIAPTWLAQLLHTT